MTTIIHKILVVLIAFAAPLVVAWAYGIDGRGDGLGLAVFMSFVLASCVIGRLSGEV